MQYNSLQDIENAFLQFVPKVTSVRRVYTLDTINELLQFLGNPQDELKIIHVAGTSGKTSTSYFMRALFQQAGMKTGLTVSPHITSIKERVQVNGDVLSNEVYIEYARRFFSAVQQSGIRPSFFEATMAFAYWVFREEKVDYAVIETGMGGLLDGSNVANRADKIVVITDIGLDHTEVLGHTISEIASQKAGIIHEGNTAFVISQSAEAISSIREYASLQNAKIEIVKPLTNVSDLPLFQQRNWSVARVAFEYVSRRDYLISLNDEQIKFAMKQTPPGRLEIRYIADKTIILDGAHNPQKLAALSDALKDVKMHERLVIANFVKAPSHKIHDNVKALQQITESLIIPEFMVVQDIGKKSLPAHEVARYVGEVDMKNIVVEKDLEKALKRALDSAYSTIIITGSLYLVSQVRLLLEKYR